MKNSPIMQAALTFSLLVSTGPTAISSVFYMPSQLFPQQVITQPIQTRVITQPAILEQFNGGSEMMQPQLRIAPPFLFNIERRRGTEDSVGSLDYGTDMFPTW